MISGGGHFSGKMSDPYSLDILVAKMMKDLSDKGEKIIELMENEYKLKHQLIEYKIKVLRLEDELRKLKESDKSESKEEISILQKVIQNLMESEKFSDSD